jgi:alkanesulfonate monooxygenase SsuD/methylene tetrahydromethanopterin reductase-like flavin-dependent oxidoreductase (luciferase family)
VGAGDSESIEENVAFGLAPDSPARRVDELHRAVLAVRDQGVPVWVGGTSRAVRALAVTEADGWNRWGGTPEVFGSERVAMTGAVTRRPFTWSWGGLVVLGASDAEASERAHRLGASPGTVVGGPATMADALARWRDAGADWIVLGPVDSRRVENVERLACDVVPRLA